MIEFEKDDDTNFHMDAIAGLSNMRARNYDIPEVDKLKAKFIAGNYPRHRDHHRHGHRPRVPRALQGSQRRQAGGVPQHLCQPRAAAFAMAEPIAPKNFEFKDMKWSLWDRWILEGDFTVKELLDWFEAKELTAYSVSAARASSTTTSSKHKERMNQKVSDLVQTVAKMTILKRKHFDIVVACEDEEGEDIDVPSSLSSSAKGCPVASNTLLSKPVVSIVSKCSRGHRSGHRHPSHSLPTQPRQPWASPSPCGSRPYLASSAASPRVSARNMTHEAPRRRTG